MMSAGNVLVFACLRVSKRCARSENGVKSILLELETICKTTGPILARMTARLRPTNPMESVDF